ncbi:hypothetical protein GCM10007216_19840 [Thalassobacillus devorans]|uniref:IstB-like ATP-binding domain-containing protein n=1 Tax=Thalassobacillus devorans TaxID=279813 RepID=A0ABQ1P211_9BACI|nr:ATP-binding protein [Thalassobacillus devorans]NIK28072.1 hypothetical protein [Thalassobacillus devorans]GGC89092.1 hypothetical protein GCM10007216_19840 [Thalassobacillus devorans]
MKCSKCEGGWIQGENGSILCNCLLEENLEKLVRNSGAPFKLFKQINQLEEMNLKNPLSEEATNQQFVKGLVTKDLPINNLIDNEARFVFRGYPGSGKSQLATTIAIEAIKSNFERNFARDVNLPIFTFVDIRKLLNQYFMEDAHKERADITNQIKKSKILIIDDIGVESHLDANGSIVLKNKVSNLILEYVETIVRDFCGLIIVTTNLGMDLRPVYQNFSQRLADTLFPSIEKNHGMENTFYYSFVKEEDESFRRKYLPVQLPI